MKCYVCGNEKDNKVYIAKEMMLGLRESFTYFQCAVCQCLQIAEIPVDLPKYYPENYVGHASLDSDRYAGLTGYFKKLRYAATLFHGNVSQKIIHAISPASQYEIPARIPMTLETKILDVGCGLGNYLYPLYELGMRNASGVDPFIKSTITYPNGYTVRKNYLRDLTGGWDVILFNHSFEHVPDPLENLKAVKRLLLPKGTCVIRIPTVSSFAWDHYGVNWYQLDAPRHFFLHSVESMKILAAKAGLEISDVIYDSTYEQFSSSEKYALDIAKNEKSPVPFFRRKYLKWKYAKRAKALNQERRGDQAAFILRPKTQS